MNHDAKGHLTKDPERISRIATECVARRRRAGAAATTREEME